MSKPVWVHPTVDRVLRVETRYLHHAEYVKYVPASELEELKAAILDLEHTMACGGHYDDYDDAIELLADKARQVGSNEPIPTQVKRSLDKHEAQAMHDALRASCTPIPTQEGEG